MNEVIHEVTQKIIKRSEKSRKIYLQRSEAMLLKEVNRSRLGCSNIAHAMAPLAEDDKETLAKMQGVNIGIITAYNDMLSAHEPFKLFPALIKRTLQDLGATAQVAGGVPAMCDGVTQSQPGMELSLFSRDNIAMGTAIGLSHNVYDGAIYLGVCDKIVPGLLIGALSFGHLPAIFMPAGPMKSGISNTNKAALRQEFAQGKIDKDALLRVESASYHSSGTCTFYGTANSNQMLLEMMGLQLPNSSFVNANTPLRELLSVEATHTLFKMCDKKNDFKPLFKILDERSFVNAIVGLMATGGSSNHTIHLIAMAKAAGIILEWEDFDAIAKVTPLMCKLYPNGSADVNHFREAGGMGVVIAQLIECGLVHEDVETVVGKGLSRYVVSPKIENAHLVYTASSIHSKNSEVISNMETPFAKEGGLKLLNGNLGQSIIKTSALKESSEVIEAPARVFNSQEALQEAFKAGHLEEDFIAVVRYQGPKANGMPELHGLMPPLGVLQDKGFKVAIVTDGRMSGASGKVPSAIHLSPEALEETSLLAKIEDGDILRFDLKKGEVMLLVNAVVLSKREVVRPDLRTSHYGMGRELFSTIRKSVSSAKEGATLFEVIGEEQS